MSLGEEVLAKLLADEALGLRTALMAEEMVTMPVDQVAD